MDVVRIFEGLTVGQKHQMIRSVRNLLNYYESQGLASKEWLDLLRKDIPKDECDIDLKIPSKDEIVASLKRLWRAEGYQSYFAVYNFVLDSGLRLTEAMRFLSSFSGTEAERQDGFYVAPLGYLRKSKVTYYAFLNFHQNRLWRPHER